MPYAPKRKGHLKRNGANLTPRLMSIVVQVAQGFDNAELAKRLFITNATTKVYISDLNRCLDISKSRELAIRCERILGCVTS